jgi:hypothetical protein
VDLFLLIGLLAAVSILGLWYFGWARYNRHKGDLALRRLAVACEGNARIADSYWADSCRLHARLRFATHWIENAQVTFRLLPRPVPVQWLLCLWRKQKETVTFEADLDYAPSLHLDLFRHRWVTHHKFTKVSAAKDWVISRPSPVVLTTRTHWTQELSPVVNALMRSRGHNLLNVRFRQQAPHLAATIDLDSFSDDETAAGFVGVLRDLAAGASTHRQ